MFPASWLGSSSARSCMVVATEICFSYSSHGIALFAVPRSNGLATATAGHRHNFVALGPRFDAGHLHAGIYELVNLAELNS